MMALAPLDNAVPPPVHEGGGEALCAMPPTIACVECGSAWRVARGAAESDGAKWSHDVQSSAVTSLLGGAARIGPRGELLPSSSVALPWFHSEYDDSRWTPARPHAALVQGVAGHKSVEGRADMDRGLASR